MPVVAKGQLPCWLVWWFGWRSGGGRQVLCAASAPTCCKRQLCVGYARFWVKLHDLVGVFMFAGSMLSIEQASSVVVLRHFQFKLKTADETVLAAGKWAPLCCAPWFQGSCRAATRLVTQHATLVKRTFVSIINGRLSRLQAGIS